MTDKDIEGVGDVINGTKYTGGDAQQEYYKLKLLQEKLKLTPGGTSEFAKKVLGQKSEKEEIEWLILAKLADITESSPEFAQVRDLTGTENKMDQAKKLAEISYNRLRAEQVMSWYSADKEDMLAHFYNRTKKSADVRNPAINNGAEKYKTSSAASALFSAATGTGR
jgi:hypothetical protein